MTELGFEPLFSNLLIVASDPRAQQELSKAYRSFGCRILLANNEEQGRSILKMEPSIDVILYDLDSGKPIAGCYEFVRFCQSAVATVPPIFVICDDVDAYFSDVFFEGVTGVFLRPLDLGEFTKAIAITYSEFMGHRERQHHRKQIHRSRAVFNRDEDKSTGFATDISLGGMFIGTMDLIPFKGQRINFSISFEGGLVLKGQAIVRWTRPEIELGRARGFGVEFVEIDTEALSSVLNVARKKADPAAANRSSQPS